MAKPYLRPRHQYPNLLQTKLPARFILMKGEHLLHLLRANCQPIRAVRMQCAGQVYSARGDDYGSDEEDNDGIRATLISFDVEATESTDAPQGLWSAELRPSVANTDSRGSISSQPTYLDTLLTQIPALLASHMLSNSITRLLMTPYDATALRLVARAYCLRNGLPCEDICQTNLLSGLSWTSAMNYLWTEFIHLLLTTEVWAVFTGLSQWYHFSEEEWAAEEAKT
jgi:hypothetical protein